MKKRSFRMLLISAVTIAALSLGACSKPADTEETSKSSESATTESTASTDGNTTADVIYTNGYIYTENEDAMEAEAFAVKDDTFIYVGADDTDELNALKGENTKVVDLDGKMVTPNLIDAHTHPATVGITKWCAEIQGETPEEYVQLVSDYLKEHSVEELPYVFFKSYPSDMFGTEGPKKELLDAVTDRPVLISDFNDHSAWANTKWLETYGAYEMDKDDPRLNGFVRTADGDFQGWIQETTWDENMDAFYERLGWRPPIDCTPELMSLVTDDLKKWGVTAAFDAYLETEMQMESIHQMDEEGKLNMYYDMSVKLSKYEDLDDALETVHRLNKTYGTDHVKMDTIKIFYDGTNELGNSALVDGTVQNPDYHGYLFMDLAQTEDTIRRSNKSGVDLHFHLVGDLAFRQVCDAVENVTKADGPLDIQIELCHCEYINPADRERPAELGIIINWTPQWSGGYFGEAARTYLGDERFDDMYQFNPTIESGAIVTFGSDIYSWGEEYRANPYYGMQTAMTRVDIDLPLKSNDGVRLPLSAKLSLEDLLKGYTINAAKQLRIDDVTGSIEVGKRANFNIYGENLFDVDPFEFKDVMPEAVIFEGNVISGEIK